MSEWQHEGWNSGRVGSRKSEDKGFENGRLSSREQHAERRRDTGDKRHSLYQGRDRGFEQHCLAAEQVAYRKQRQNLIPLIFML